MKNWFKNIVSKVKSNTSRSTTKNSTTLYKYQKGDLVKVAWGPNRGQIGRILRVGKITDSVYVEFDREAPGYWVDIAFVTRVDTLIG